MVAVMVMSGTEITRDTTVFTLLSALESHRTDLVFFPICILSCSFARHDWSLNIIYVLQERTKNNLSCPWVFFNVWDWQLGREKQKISVFTSIVIDTYVHWNHNDRPSKPWSLVLDYILHMYISNDYFRHQRHLLCQSPTWSNRKGWSIQDRSAFVQLQPLSATMVGWTPPPPTPPLPPPPSPSPSLLNKKKHQS